MCYDRSRQNGGTKSGEVVNLGTLFAFTIKLNITS